MNQNKILTIVKGYLSLEPEGLTIRQLGMLLCYDLNISYRSARENYVLPLIAHRVLILIKDLSIYFIINPKCHIYINGKISIKKFITSINKNEGVSVDANK